MSRINSMLSFMQKKCKMIDKPRILYVFLNSFNALDNISGAQWLHGIVLDSTPRGRGFESHGCHCVVSFSKTHVSLLSTG